MPPDDIQIALSLLDDLTVRQLRDTAPDRLIEDLFTELGYTVHRRFACRAHMEMWTWVMQNRVGEWLLFRLGTDDFMLNMQRSLLPLPEAWTHVSLDAHINVLHTAMSDTFEPVRGATPNDLLLAILTLDDDPGEQADLLGVIDWLISEQGADLDGMRLVAILSGHTVPDPLPVLPYTCHSPLQR